MEIASTTSSVRAMIDMQAAETRARQADQAQTFPAPPQTSASQAQAQPSEVSTEEAAAAARAVAERNRPVVNTSGQLVGTRINTTA